MSAMFWTDEQVAYLVEHYTTDGPAKVAAALGRSHMSVTRKMAHLRAKARARRDVDFLRAVYKYGEVPTTHVVQYSEMMPAVVRDGYPDVPWQCRLSTRDQGVGVMDRARELRRQAKRRGDTATMAMLDKPPGLRTHASSNVPRTMEPPSELVHPEVPYHIRVSDRDQGRGLGALMEVRR